MRFRPYDAMSVNPIIFSKGILIDPPPIPKKPLANPEMSPIIPASNSSM